MKKRILIPLICVIACMVVLFTTIMIASNYKKVYKLDKNEYMVYITPASDKVENDYYSKKSQEIKEGKNIEIKMNVQVVKYKKGVSHSEENIQKIIYSEKATYKKGDYDVEYNANVYTQLSSIPKGGYYTFIEYPLMKSKNKLIVVYSYYNED